MPFRSSNILCRSNISMATSRPIGAPDPVAVYELQRQELLAYEDAAQARALQLLQACRCGNVLEALQLMGCTHCEMLVNRIVEAVEEGPERFLASQPVEKEVPMRAAVGADDAKIQDLATDIAISM
jgi:hypothetical protein